MTIEYLRSFRIAGYAMFDFAASFILLAILAPGLSWAFKKVGIIIPFRSWLIWAIPFGMVVHLAFGSMTPMTKALVDPQGHWLLKIVMLALIIAGFVGIKYE
jgi:hypothetical protein